MKYGTRSKKLTFYGDYTGTGMGVSWLELRHTAATGTGVLRAYIYQSYGRTCHIANNTTAAITTTATGYRLVTSAEAVQCLILVPWQLFQSL